LWLKWEIESKWVLPVFNFFYFLKPESIDAEEIATSTLLISKNIEKVIKLLAVPNFEDGRTLSMTMVAPPSGNGMIYTVLCDHKKASRIATELFRSKICKAVTSFEFEPSRVKFTVSWKPHFYKRPKSGIDDLSKAIEAIRFVRETTYRALAEAIGTDLPTVQPWNERKTLNREAFRRELAAFDKRTDEDAELWPGQTGKDLSNLKSRARDRFKKRLARLEQAAEERRRTLTTG